MSRTYKDRPYKLKHEPWDKDRVLVRCEVIRTNWLTKELEEYTTSRYLESKTTKTKKRKEVDTQDHWMRTPSWWTHLTMIRPERRKAKVLLVSIPADLEEADIPDLGRKPHIYFYQF